MAWTDAKLCSRGARSHSGWIIQLGEAPVSWRSSRQTCVTMRTAESELYASVEGALALVSFEALLRELDDIYLEDRQYVIGVYTTRIWILEDPSSED